MTEELQTRFNLILKDTQSQIRAYIAGMGVQICDIDDLAQEVYIAFYGNIEKMPKGLLEIRWLKGIAKNICLSHFRKNRNKIGKEMEYLAEVISGHIAIFENFSEESPVSNSLKHCLEKLTENNRKLIKLKYYEGYDTKYIAGLMNKSLEAVRVTFFRIKEVLKECVKKTLAEQEKI